MPDEEVAKACRIVDEGVGDDIGVLPPFPEREFCGGRAHGGVPHGEGELLVAKRDRTMQWRRRAGRHANDATFLRFAVCRSAEVKIAGRNDRLGALGDQLRGICADGDWIALAIEINELERTTQNAALLVDYLDGELSALEPRRIEWRLNAGEAERATNHDRLLGLDGAYANNQSRRKRNGDRRQQAGDCRCSGTLLLWLLLCLCRNHSLLPTHDLPFVDYRSGAQRTCMRAN